MQSRLLALVFALLLPVALSAQVGTQASFIGTVTDATGAVVPGAEVNVTHLSTGFKVSATTDGAGAFSIMALPIGDYSVSVSAPGFKAWELKRAQLTVGSRSRISPVLQVGEQIQTIVVEATQDVIQTEKGTVEMVVQMQQIKELPLYNRNPLALVAMTPGMVVEGLNSGDERASFVQGQGLRSNQTQFQMDGLSANTPMTEGGATVPTTDAIAEFTVQTNSFNAESGRSPMQVLVVGKSGSNEFHGSLWEYLQNDALNASKTFATSKPKLRRNQFGGTVGGPVVKNRTFFFGSFDQTIIRGTSVFNKLSATDAMEHGDFSALTKVIRDPLANKAPFAGNKIPESRISSASSYLNKFVLNPNSPDGYFKANAPTKDDPTETMFRLDHQFTDSQRLYGRYVGVHVPTQSAGYRPENTADRVVNQHNIGVNYTWTMSPSTVLTLTGGTLRTRNAFDSPTVGEGNKNETDEAGIQGFPTEGREKFVGMPDVSFAGGWAGFSSPWGVPGALWGSTYNAKASLNHIRAKHTLAFGYEFDDRHTYGEHASSYSRGVFTFNNLYSGDGFSDYLLGYASGTSRSFPLHEFGTDRAPYSGFYANDTWRVLPNLTFDLGLRYELWHAHSFVGGAGATWDNTRQKVVAGMDDGKINYDAQPTSKYLAAATQGKWITAAEAGYPEGLFEPTGHFAPRIGVTYRPFSGHDFVVRGGYGHYYNSFTGNRAASSIIGMPYWTYETMSFGLQTLQSYTNAWPVDPKNFVNTALAAPAYNIEPAKTIEWNISVQTALPFKTALTASYVGNRVPNQVGARDYNAASVGPHTNLQADKPNPTYGNIAVIENGGRFWYNALQTKLERRFAQGLAVTVSYSFSRSMTDDNADSETATFVPYAPEWYTRQRTASDRRHIAYSSVLWELPVGHGRKYLSGLGRVSNGLIGGWQLGATYQAMSGTPLSILGGNANLGNGYSSRADVVSEDYKLDNPSSAMWFNKDAFKAAPMYTFGNGGFGLVEGPGTHYLSTSLSKNFHMTESKYVQFRWEAFNTPNHVNYATPTGNLTNANVGKLTASGDARFMQVALRFVF